MTKPSADKPSGQPLGLPLNDGLGAAAPERADFEAWISDGGKFPQAAGRDQRGEYRLLQAYSAWKAWRAASAAQRARTADLCGNLAAISWAEWDASADPAEQGKALALEHVAALLAEPNAEFTGIGRNGATNDH